MKNYFIIGSILLIIVLFVIKKTVNTTKMREYSDYFKVIFSNETLFSDPDKIIVDTGGVTKYGISDLADGKTDGKYYGEDIRSMTISRAMEIYKKNYFTPFASKFVTYPNFALHVFDISVNAGIGRAKEFVTNIFGTIDSKIILQKLKSMGESDAVRLLKDQRKKHYNSLVIKNPTKYEKFLKGWINRVDKTKFP